MYVVVGVMICKVWMGGFRLFRVCEGGRSVRSNNEIRGCGTSVLRKPRALKGQACVYTLKIVYWSVLGCLCVVKLYQSEAKGNREKGQW